MILYNLHKNYKLIASTGHSPTQAPQSTHASASITALSSSIVIASTGQESTHALHPVQISVSTTAAIVFTFHYEIVSLSFHKLKNLFVLNLNVIIRNYIIYIKQFSNFVHYALFFRLQLTVILLYSSVGFNLNE